MDIYFLKKAYELQEVENYFESFTIDSAKELLLNTYKHLDSVYDLLEKCGVVDRYSKFEILKDIVIYENYGELFIELSDKSLYQLDMRQFAYDAVNIYVKPKH